MNMPTERDDPAYTLSDHPDPSGLPPETPSRKLLIRTVALVAIVASLVYLTWRIGWTLNLEQWWISLPLLIVEIHIVISLGLLTISLWSIDSLPPAKPVSSTTMKVAVLIPTYNEDIPVLLPTIAAALAIEIPHETWVLDDGQRPDVRELAEQLGASYLTRPDNEHAKAGNVNHALGVIDADAYAIFDADHVARPEFLSHTLGYLEDPRVALVQTPQDFYNEESFEHRKSKFRRWFGNADDEQVHEQQLFYRVVQPGKNALDAVFWCGTNALVRAEALADVGGVATETLTEDIHTTIRMHRRGWRTVYHNEVLARGLAPTNVSQYQNQRLRWGRGAMELIKLERPVTGRGLTFIQRIAYAATLLWWFDAWRSLTFLLLPIIVLLTGAMPITAAPLTFAIFFVPTFAVQRLALILLGRRRAPQIFSTMFDLIRMSANLKATLGLVLPSRGNFEVTDKGRVGSERRRADFPILLIGILVLSLFSAVWAVLTLLGLTPLHYGIVWTAYTAAAWLFVNVVLLSVAIRRIRHIDHASERRTSVRFDVQIPGRFAGRDALIENASMTGAKLIIAADDAGSLPLGDQLEFDFDGSCVKLYAMVRHQRYLGDEVELGMEFTQHQGKQIASLVQVLFNERKPITLVPSWAQSEAAATTSSDREDETGQSA